MQLRAEVNFLDILGHGILWFFLTLFTLGFAAFFFPYSFAKFIINRSEVVIDGQRYGLWCDLDAFSQLGHIILWFFLSIITLGLCYFFYMYKVWNFAINNTAVLKD